jgi:hypothetical protein
MQDAPANGGWANLQHRSGPFHSIEIISAIELNHPNDLPASLEYMQAWRVIDQNLFSGVHHPRYLAGLDNDFWCAVGISWWFSQRRCSQLY